jgi:hypothetical protein
MECKGRVEEGFDCRPFHYRACKVEIGFEGKDDGGIVMVLATISCGLFQISGMILCLVTLPDKVYAALK